MIFKIKTKGLTFFINYSVEFELNDPKKTFLQYNYFFDAMLYFT